MTPPLAPVRYRIDLREIARVHSAHARTLEHAAAQAWAEVARQRLQAASERWQRVTMAA